MTTRISFSQQDIWSESSEVWKSQTLEEMSFSELEIYSHILMKEMKKRDRARAAAFYMNELYKEDLL